MIDGDKGRANTWLFRVDKNGREVSRLKVAENVSIQAAYAKIAFEPGAVFVSLGGIKIRKFDLTGKLLWETPNVTCPGQFTNVVSGLYRHGDMLLLMPDGDGCFFAYEAATGKPRWTFASPNGLSFTNRPLVHNGVVYAANTIMWALDAKTGQILAMSQRNPSTQGATGNPVYDPSTNEIILWGRELQYYKPLR